MWRPPVEAHLMTAANGPQNVISGLEAAARAARGSRGLPPVERWNPPDRGELDMRIAANGTWSYLGSAIERPALVRLFSSILRRDGDRYVLVTPAEKFGIVVDDAPFLAVELEAVGDGEAQRLVFRTNVDDTMVAGPAHALRVEINPITGEPRPYVHVRGGLEALVTRAVFYELVSLSQTRDTDRGPILGVWSDGVFFPLGPVPQEVG